MATFGKVSVSLATLKMFTHLHNFWIILKPYYIYNVKSKKLQHFFFLPKLCKQVGDVWTCGGRCLGSVQDSFTIFYWQHICTIEVPSNIFWLGTSLRINHIAHIFNLLSTHVFLFCFVFFLPILLTFKLLPTYLCS